MTYTIENSTAATKYVIVTMLAAAAITGSQAVALQLPTASQIQDRQCEHWADDISTAGRILSKPADEFHIDSMGPLSEEDGVALWRALNSPPIISDETRQLFQRCDDESYIDDHGVYRIR